METRSDAERRWRDFRRVLGDVGKAHAERVGDPGGVVLGQSTPVVVEWDAERVLESDIDEIGYVGCQLSCEIVCEGPVEESGSRSHANYLRALAVELGVPQGQGTVGVRCIRRNPLEFAVEGVELPEEME